MAVFSAAFGLYKPPYIPLLTSFIMFPCISRIYPLHSPLIPSFFLIHPCRVCIESRLLRRQYRDCLCVRKLRRWYCSRSRLPLHLILGEGNTRCRLRPYFNTLVTRTRHAYSFCDYSFRGTSHVTRTITTIDTSSPSDSLPLRTRLTLPQTHPN